jgi:chromosomal replication initiation ATPase DnaA
MNAPALSYDHLADVFAKAFGDTGTISDALRVMDAYRLRSEARRRHAESFEIVRAAAKYCGVAVRRVLDSRDRHPAVCDARWISARILRERNWSTPHIAAVLGLRNHTTVLNALDQVNGRPDLIAGACEVLGRLGSESPRWNTDGRSGHRASR